MTLAATVLTIGLAIRARPPMASVAGYSAAIPAAAEPALALCREAARTKAAEPEAVCTALLEVEQTMRAAAKEDGGELSRATLANLDGAWRLVFTTGTIDMQNKMGKINYFPIRATQSFDTSTMRITNGIYLGDFALLKFFGEFEWLEDRRRLEFDFDQIAVLGFTIDLPKGGAEELGAATGLGSKNNVELAKKGKKAFFNVRGCVIEALCRLVHSLSARSSDSTLSRLLARMHLQWISADEEVALARGGGGGLALWRRE